MRLHFGLGDAQKVDAVNVQWPSGKKETFAIENINRIIELKEGAGDQPSIGTVTGSPRE
jgi:hypothetical protein